MFLMSVRFTSEAYCLIPILLFCCLVTTSVIPAETAYSSSSEAERDLMTRSVQSPHGPIVITGDSDFISQGWLGSGTEQEPYLLDGVSIMSNQTCINITHTTAFFKIKDCFISSVPEEEQEPSFNHGIHFANVSNGIIENCEISTGYWGIWILDSRFCEVTNNEVVAGDASIVIENSNGCTVGYNTVRDYRGDGIAIDNSNQTHIFFNLVKGGYGCQDGIGVCGYSWNCTIANNTITDHYSGGIDVRQSVDGIVCNNTIVRSGIALALQYSVRGLVMNNRFINNAIGIIVASDSSNNTIYLNRFNGNPLGNANDHGASNIWDDGESRGNWWDDYVGYGTYSIPGSAGSVDRFPEPRSPNSIMFHYVTLLVLTVAGIGLIVGIALGSYRVWNLAVKRYHRQPSVE
jgi:parallel beta-helix repeat protein